MSLFWPQPLRNPGDRTVATSLEPSLPDDEQICSVSGRSILNGRAATLVAAHRSFESVGN